MNSGNISEFKNMIRPYQSEDMGQITGIWLEASVKAHHFIEASFWESKTDDMRNIYLPSSDIFVSENRNTGEIYGFISLTGDFIAALFVSPFRQGKGTGTALLHHAKSLHQRLRLTVYAENLPSVAFYKNQGFYEIEKRTEEITGHDELVMAWEKH